MISCTLVNPELQEDDPNKAVFDASDELVYVQLYEDNKIDLQLLLNHEQAEDLKRHLIEKLSVVELKYNGVKVTYKGKA